MARERAQERLRCQNPDYKAKKTAHNSLRRSLERISFRLLNKEEKQQIYNIYEESHKMTQSSGNTYQVDHIIPLAHGGLHVPENLQILSQEENLKKGTSVDGIRKDKIESSLRAIVARYGQVLQKLSDF